MKYGYNLISCDQVTVTKVVTREGEGTAEEPVRHVTWYYDDNGEMIFRHDMIEQERIKAQLGEPLL